MITLFQVPLDTLNRYFDIKWHLFLFLCPKVSREHPQTSHTTIPTNSVAPANHRSSPHRDTSIASRQRWSSAESLSTHTHPPALLIWNILRWWCIANALVPYGWWSSSFLSQVAQRRKRCKQCHPCWTTLQLHHPHRHHLPTSQQIRATPASATVGRATAPSPAKTPPSPAVVPSSSHQQQSITFRWFGCRQTLCSSTQHTKMFQFYIFAFRRIPERRCLALKLTRSPEVPFVSIHGTSFPNSIQPSHASTASRSPYHHFFGKHF